MYVLSTGSYLANKNIYEESNAGVWDSAGGNQDVPAGEGVPETPR